MSRADVETVVVGAGVAGLATARALAAAGQQVLVLEQHERTGAETTSRNSEVIHAGIYYPPGSLKARLCVQGRKQLYRFADENGVTVRRYSKLLVAVHAAEVPKLKAMAETAARNGVDDLQPLDAAAARALEPQVACVAALLSPSTGVIDSHGLMLALEGHIQACGGDVALNSRVDALARDAAGNFVLSLGGRDGASRLTARHLVIAAGLWSSQVARMLFSGAGYQPPETYYAKGHYFTLLGRAPFQRLIYPMPTDGGLGTHLTFDAAGAAKFGPDVTWVRDVTYGFDDDGGARRADFERAIRLWWPGLPNDALDPGYTGMRPKLSQAGEAAADFAIHGPAEHGTDRLVILYGIESPGLTASLALGQYAAAHLGAPALA